MNKKKGRPKKAVGEKFVSRSISFPPKMFAKAIEYADSKGVDLSKVVQEALRKHLKID